MFAYSMREKTHAYRAFKDDVPSEVKQERLTRLIEVVHQFQLEKNLKEIGKTHLVLLDGLGKKPD
jgi:tRNA-2-methylthio-N6-dimethylallyladenosine synthase